MTHKLAPLAAVLLLVFGCGRSGKMQRDQQQYQVVQEGSASGVTSTINGPGETAPPLTNTMTNTNADTTTNFTIPTNPNPLGNDTAGSMASSLPPAYVPPRTTTAPRPLRPRGDAPVVTDTIGSTTPPMPKEHAAPPREQTDTSATDTMATTPTDTSSTTTTSSEKKKKDSDSKGDQQQPAPPPPPTDTTGTRG